MSAALKMTDQDQRLAELGAWMKTEFGHRTEGRTPSLDVPNAQLGGQTLRQAAAASDAGLNTVKCILRPTSGC